MRSSIRPIHRFSIILIVFALISLGLAWFYVHVQPGLDPAYVYLMKMRLLSLLGFGALVAMIAALFNHIDDDPPSPSPKR